MDKKDLIAYPGLTYGATGISIQLNCRGAQDYAKLSFPVKYGLFSRAETPEVVFEFNQNHEIKMAKSKTKSWPHPLEWLKRTMGNDWVYYSTGGYAGVFESIGEYYLPNLAYPTNSLLGGKPFEENCVNNISSGWQEILSGIETRPDMPGPVALWLEQIKQITPEHLENKAQKLFAISGTRASVLPPDARHSDYDIIPLTIADGCLYKCRFCQVKNKKPFTPRSRQNIKEQVLALQELYSQDLVNYNALFLGEHDALLAPGNLILYAARTAYEIFNWDKGYMKTPMLYLFGSVDALLQADDHLFSQLNTLPFHTCINIGLESADEATLALLGKPISAGKVLQAFDKIQALNQTHGHVEITCNFVMNRDLPPSHTQSLLGLVRGKIDRVRPKGSVYLSPLQFDQPSREILFDFFHLKTQSRLPMFLYIIQRL